MAAKKTTSAKTRQAKSNSRGSSRTKNQKAKKQPAKKPRTKIKRRRWFLLNSLVELDWDNYIRWTVAKQTLLKDKVHIIDHDYEIKPVYPPADNRSPLQLNAGDRFLIIPIKETRTAGTQRRFVLVREEQDFEKGRLYLADVEPAKDASAGSDAFYKRIYVLGGANPEAAKLEPRIIGAVEAVLTVSDPLAPWTGFPAAASAQLAPLATAAVVAEQPSAPAYDEKLLNRLDRLNELKERYRPADNDFADLQESLDDYIGARYDLTIIPIEINQTRYNEEQGHILAGTSHLAGIDDGIITAVCRSGYRHNDQVVRKANVIVNRHATSTVKLKHLTIDGDTLQVEMNAPKEKAVGELMREAAVQIEALDSLYEWIYLFTTGTAAQLSDAAQRFLHTNFTYESSREILRGANARHLQMKSLEHDASRLVLTLLGENRPVVEFCAVLDAEASCRLHESYYPPPQQGWIFQKLNELQRMPDGINQAKFAQKGDLVLREILGRITFASDFQLPSAQPQPIVSQPGDGTAQKPRSSAAPKSKSSAASKPKSTKGQQKKKPKRQK